MGLETLLIVGAIGAGIAAATGAFGGGKKEPEVQPTPKAPSEEAAAAAAKAAEMEKRARKAGRAKSIMTGPQGILGEAPVVKKTLLGE